MPPKSVQRLKLLIDRLHPEEVGHLQSLMDKPATDLKTVRSKQLLTTLLAPEEESVEIFKQQFGHLSPALQRKTASQLRRSVETAVLLNESLQFEGAYDDNLRMRVEIEKKVQLARILFASHEPDEGLRVANDAAAEARTYEYYDLLVALLNLQCLHFYEFGPLEKAEALEAESQRAEKCRRAAQNARKAYYRTTQAYGFKGNNRSSDPMSLMSLENEIKQLKSDYESTDSAITGFYYYLLQLQYHQVQSKYDQATQYCHKLVDIVRDNPSVYMRRRMGITYLNFSQNELFNGFYDYALGFAKQAASHFEPNTINHNLANELAFYARFYAGQTKDAGSTVAELLFNEDNPQSEFRRSWRSYLLAAVFFVMGEHQRVHRTLHATAAIQKDKEGWNVGIRILTIMNLLELKRYDHADQAIVNLRHFVRQGIREVTVRERDHIIVEILATLHRNFYDFETALEECKPLLTQLVRLADKLQWQVQSPELIPFHKWFEAQLHGQPYQPRYDAEYINVLDLTPGRKARRS